MLTNSSFADTLSFDNHTFVYQLDKKWKVFSNSSDEGYLQIVFKRIGIKDSKGVEVIPNAVIKLIKTSSGDAVPDGLTPIQMFTSVALLRMAPPEVMDDFKNSKDISKEYGLHFEHCYGFNSPYRDGFNENHTCLYFTIYDEQKYGVFILFDSTEEVYKKIKQEVSSFLKSITMI